MTRNSRQAWKLDTAFDTYILVCFVGNQRRHQIIIKEAKHTSNLAPNNYRKVPPFAREVVQVARGTRLTHATYLKVDFALQCCTGGLQIKRTDGLWEFPQTFLQRFAIRLVQSNLSMHEKKKSLISKDWSVQTVDFQPIFYTLSRLSGTYPYKAMASWLRILNISGHSRLLWLATSLHST